MAYEVDQPLKMTQQELDNLLAASEAGRRDGAHRPRNGLLIANGNVHRSFRLAG